jgi:hypothetical protein
MLTDNEILESYGMVNTNFNNIRSEELFGTRVCSWVHGDGKVTVYGHGSSRMESVRSLLLELRATMAAAVDDLDGGDIYYHYGEYDVFDEQDGWEK